MLGRKYVKKIRQYFLVLVGAVVIILATAFASYFVLHYPYTSAVAVMLIICILLLRVIVYQILVRLAPQYIAEKQLKKFTLKDQTAYIAYYHKDTIESNEEAGPEIFFTANLIRREGMRNLIFSGKLPSADMADLLKLEKGSEISAGFVRDGNKAVYFNGGLEILHTDLNRNSCIFQISVSQIRLSGRRKTFTLH